VYVESRRSRRDLGVLVLLDISGSAAEPSGAGGTVHDHQLSAAASLTAALDQVGDRVALYGFRSQGRTAVHVFPVKRFDEGFSTAAQERLGGLSAGGFTRLGAAIRHGAAILDHGGGTGRRLLVVLSDGFAYDHGYEGAYGEADARRALSEARHRGIGCLCLSIAAATDPDALRRVFGTAAHASLKTESQMAHTIAPLFRAALGTAEYQRRRSQRTTRSSERQSMERSRA
jgi:nitric oxide reductase NorD protein